MHAYVSYKCEHIIRQRLINNLSYWMDYVSGTFLYLSEENFYGS